MLYESLFFKRLKPLLFFVCCFLFCHPVGNRVLMVPLFWTDNLMTAFY